MTTLYQGITRSWRWLLLLVAVLVAGVLLSTSDSRFAAAQERPNIIFIITDDQDPASLQYMPYLTSLPYGSWATFDNTIVNDSICGPSRATAITGQYSHVHGVKCNGWGKDLNEHNTIARLLSDAGYENALIGKYSNGFPWGRGASYKPAGWDIFRAQKGGATKLGGWAADWLDDCLPGSAPCFLYLAPKEPHPQTKPEAKYRKANIGPVSLDTPAFNELDVSDKPQWVQKLKLLKTKDINSWTKKREASLRGLLGVDEMIRTVIETLVEHGELDNTIIVVTSDHSDAWGEHRWTLKHCPWLSCHRVHLYIRFPELGENRAYPQMVSNTDFVPTFAELAGTVPDWTVNGTSLLPLLRNPGMYWPNEVLVEKHPDGNLDFGYYGLYVPEWSYVRYTAAQKRDKKNKKEPLQEVFTSETEFYDLVNDPWQLENLADRPECQIEQAAVSECAAVRLYLDQRLEARLGGEGPPEPPATPSPTPTETFTPTPTATTTEEPTATFTPTATPSPVATDEPTPSPTATEESGC